MRSVKLCSPAEEGGESELVGWVGELLSEVDLVEAAADESMILVLLGPKAAAWGEKGEDTGLGAAPEAPSNDLLKGLADIASLRDQGQVEQR